MSDLCECGNYFQTECDYCNHPEWDKCDSNDNDGVFVSTFMDISDLVPKTQVSKVEVSEVKNNQSKYSYSSIRDHIYNIPDCYVGSDKKIKRKERLLNPAGVITVGTVEVPEAMQTIFRDILSLGSDGVLNNQGDDRWVEVFMDHKTVTIKFSGCLPFDCNDDGKWIGGDMFSNFLANNNTNSKQNGYTYMYANIFSKYFKVSTYKKECGITQTCTDNMKNINESCHCNGYGEEYTEIKYVMDFERFGYKLYTNEHFAIYGTMVLDMAMTNNMKYNYCVNYGYGVVMEQKSDSMDLLKYSRYYFPPTFEMYEPFVFHSDNVDMVVYYYPNLTKIDHISFAGDNYTRDGGVHVNSAYSKIKRCLGKDVRDDIILFITFKIDRPLFDCQAKTTLRGPRPEYKFDTETKERLVNWYDNLTSKDDSYCKIM